MNIPCIFLLLFILGSASPASEYRHLSGFAVPKQFYSDGFLHPVSYIEALPVADTNAKLSLEQQRRLAHLFFAAHDACVSKYQQGYFFDTSKPAVRLLLTQFPDLRSLRIENGNLIYSGKIADYVRARFPASAK